MRYATLITVDPRLIAVGQEPIGIIHQSTQDLYTKYLCGEPGGEGEEEGRASSDSEEDEDDDDADSFACGDSYLDLGTRNMHRKRNQQKKKKRAEDDGLVLLLLHVTRALKEACCLPSGTRDPEGWMRRFACGGRIWPGVDSPGLSGKGSALD